MTKFHHKKVPEYSTLLSGSIPPDDIGVQSDFLLIWYDNTETSWVGDGEKPHMHASSDECFIVLKGSLIVEVEEEKHTIGPREFCFFPRGLYHAITEVHPPVETLMLRAPSVNDKLVLDRQ